MATGPTPAPSFSDKEKTNHTRLSRLLIDIGRRVLQDVFDSIHPPSSLHGVLNSAPELNKLHRLQSRKILFDQQWNTLYPTSGIAESKNFDITLLFLLLRNICGLRPPASTGSWDKEPLPTDLCIEADLVRIKRCRNEIYAHRVVMALTDNEFENSWDDIKAALNRLGKLKYKEEIERLKFASVDPENDKCFVILCQKWDEEEGTLGIILDKVERTLEKVTEKKTAKDDFSNVHENRAKKDVESYAAKLKEAIAKQTDMQTKGIINAESVKTDNIFTNLVIYHEKQNVQHHRKEEDQRERKTFTEIKKCSEIFIDEGDGMSPKIILVSGEPGIGKTMFSQKLVRDLATNNISIPEVIFTYFITFRQLNELDDDKMNVRELLNLCPFLDDTAMIDEAVMEYMCQNSAQLFVVLDGLDESKDRSKILSDFERRFPNSSKDKMPVAALLSKLIRKKILCDSAIMVTSRPRAANEFNEKIHCDRYVQISGFSETQVVEYVKKFFSSKPEQVKKKALDKVLGSSHYLSFGSVPFRCYLMCIFIQWEITSKGDNSIPGTLTEFYSQVISCIERNYNRVIEGLDERSTSLAVDVSLANFAKLATHLTDFAEENRFSFTLNDLEKLQLSAKESLQITSSNLILCSPVSSNSPFQKPTCEYSFAHFTIQEFFVGWYFAKMAGAMPKQETTEIVKIFTSGCLGLRETKKNEELMLELLKCVRRDEGRSRRVRLVFLRCLYEFGQDKQVTTQQLTTNPDNRYWDSDGWIRLYHITDNDCSTVVCMLLHKSCDALLPSPPHLLFIEDSLLTCRGLNCVFSFLTKSNCTITKVVLMDCKLDDSCAECLSQHLSSTNINQLNLSTNKITDIGVKHIMNHCPIQLTKLNLSHNGITDVGVQHIVNHCTCHLAKLNLSYNKITDNGVQHIANHRLIAQLTELILSSNEITNIGVQHIVNHCPSQLTCLDLSDNDITDVGVQQIVDRWPSHLTRLILRDTDSVSNECKSRTAKWCDDNGFNFMI